MQFEVEAKQRELECAAADVIDPARFARAQREWEEAGKRVQAAHEGVVARLRAELAARDGSIAEARVAAAEEQRLHADNLAAAKMELITARTTWAAERQSADDASRRALAAKDDEIRSLKLEVMVAKADGGARPVGSPEAKAQPNARGGAAVTLEAEIKRLQAELDGGVPDDVSSVFDDGGKLGGRGWGSGEPPSSLLHYVDKEAQLLRRAGEFARKQRAALADRYTDLRREKDAWKAAVDDIGLRSGSETKRRVLKVGLLRWLVCVRARMSVFTLHCGVVMQEMKRALDQQTENLNKEVCVCRCEACSMVSAREPCVCLCAASAVEGDGEMAEGSPAKVGTTANSGAQTGDVLFC